MKLNIQMFGGRGASSSASGGGLRTAAAYQEIIGDRGLGVMTWKEVVEANTNFVKEKADWTGIRDGYDKFNPKTWTSIGGGGMIKKSDYKKVITKDEWKKARKAQREYEKAMKDGIPF